MLVPNHNPQLYKEHIVSFISFSFVEGVTIVDWISNMKLYLSNIYESYKDIIIFYLVNLGTGDLSLHIVNFCIACAVDEDKQSINMFL